MMMNGFTFPYGKKDIFVETKLVRKTNTLASKILYKMELPDNPTTRKELLSFLRKATCEIKMLPNGRQYYEISGDGFGGRGSFVDDEMTVIIKL